MKPLALNKAGEFPLTYTTMMPSYYHTAYNKVISQSEASNVQRYFMYARAVTGNTVAQLTVGRVTRLFL